MLKFGELSEVSFGMLKLGELSEVSFGLMNMLGWLEAENDVKGCVIPRAIIAL